MAISLIQPSFSSGELSPNLFGRVDMTKFHIGAATMSNFFVNYRGGASSRAGTKYVGWSAMSGLPMYNANGSTMPRLIRFQSSLNQGIVLEFGDGYLRFIMNGAYITESAMGIGGLGGNGVYVPGSSGQSPPWAQWNRVYISGLPGMPDINNRTFQIYNGGGAAINGDVIYLADLFDAPMHSAFGYTGGGQASRIYTIGSPYRVWDLPLLKFAQSVDVMTFVHPNYPPYDLKFYNNANWTLTATNFDAPQQPPTIQTATPTETVNGTVLYVTITNPGSGYTTVPHIGFSGAAGHGATFAATVTGGALSNVTVVTPGSGYAAADSDNLVVGGGAGGAVLSAHIGPDPNGAPTYSYVVTGVSSDGKSESAASSVINVTTSVDMAEKPGSIILVWTPTSTAAAYNVYKAPPVFNGTPPYGTLYGYIGTALGTSFTDNNITPDFTKTPPMYNNPFAPGAALSFNFAAWGAGYTYTPGYTVHSNTGNGRLSVSPVMTNGYVSSAVIINPGAGYGASDWISFDGGGATATASAYIVPAPLSGTYPSVVTYFQDRRVYANTLNKPDTYFMSKPGAFTDFSFSPIPIDSDAIIGSPWATQVNGIQFMVPVPTGLIALTGASAWLLSGGGGVGTPITPTSQFAQQQAYVGCHDHLQPIQINYDVLYVQSKGSIVRDLTYNLWVNIYTGADISVMSDHLFMGHQLREWAWAEEPHKIVWICRDDGILLSLSFLKEQEVMGWARHNTNGQFVSVCTVTELVTQPNGSTVYADVPYFVVARQPVGFIGTPNWMYYIERMDPRIWTKDIETSWCVDAGMTNGVAPVIGTGPLPAPGSTTVYGLAHLEGMSVNVVADGVQQPAQVVSGGKVTVPVSARYVIAGLPYQCQLQTLNTDVPGEATVQGKRKNIYAVTVRVKNGRGVRVGANMANSQDGTPIWWTMPTEIKDPANGTSAGLTQPLFTGDERVNIPASWRKGGQVAVSQDWSYPVDVLAVIPEEVMGDSNG
jgi:hypothetical protein